jgi:hypothetical protein
MMQEYLSSTVLVNGASAVFTAVIFCAMQLAFRADLARQPRWWDVTDSENEFATPYFGRVN